MKRIFIANRGEVALRILQAVHELGMQGVLAVSRQDEMSLAARAADETVLLPGETLGETYLNGKALIAAARKKMCHLLHPGFGFLSEDHGFAKAVIDQGLQWIGPTPVAMRAVSNKLAAKELARKHRVPTAPWYIVTENLAKKEFREIAERIGFPCLVKAVGGGGGKGLKRAEREEDLPAIISSARREAKNAFGNDQVMVESLIEPARHVEIQIFGDTHGEIHLFGERDCSVQRRFQKVIEESPAPDLSVEMRKILEGYARLMAEEIRYQNAGTVEFLLHAGDLEPYFMEVNTRLQVEHGVTEERYGVDLVKMQILTALGEGIEHCLVKTAQENHVIELRLYAEDAAMNFLPQPGRIEFLHFPYLKGLRVERAVETGSVITGDYDPMIAKLIVTGRNRQEAIRKGIVALQQTEILGPTTNRDFLIAVLENPLFQAGGVSTHFLRDAFRLPQISPRDLALAVAKALSGGEASNPAAEPTTGVFGSLHYGRERL